MALEHRSHRSAELDLPSAESLSVLYLRVAGTLERSAALAQDHAERLSSTGQTHSASLELERAGRAREAARRGRALASRLTAGSRPGLTDPAYANAARAARRRLQD